MSLIGRYIITIYAIRTHHGRSQTELIKHTDPTRILRTLLTQLPYPGMR